MKEPVRSEIAIKQKIKVTRTLSVGVLISQGGCESTKEGVYFVLRLRLTGAT